MRLDYITSSKELSKTENAYIHIIATVTFILKEQKMHTFMATCLCSCKHQSQQGQKKSCLLQTLKPFWTTWKKPWKQLWHSSLSHWSEKPCKAEWNMSSNQSSILWCIPIEWLSNIEVSEIIFCLTTEKIGYWVKHGHKYTSECYNLYHRIVKIMVNLALTQAWAEDNLRPLYPLYCIITIAQNRTNIWCEILGSFSLSSTRIHNFLKQKVASLLWISLAYPCSYYLREKIPDKFA